MKKFCQKNIAKLVFHFGLMSSSVLPNVGSSATSVRGGGDSLQMRLSTIRSSIKELFTDLKRNPIDLRDCLGTNRYSQLQCNEIFNYLKQNGSSFIQQASFRMLIPFEILSEAEFTDSQPELGDFAAYTEFTEKGPIWFSRARIKNYSPRELFGLVVHELMHKIPLQDGAFLTDDQEYSNFDSGRDFIDSFAQWVSQIAEDRHLLGSVFIVEDLLECSLESPENDVLKQRFAMRRRYDRGQKGKYESSYGDSNLQTMLTFDFQYTNDLWTIELQVRGNDQCDKNLSTELSLKRYAKSESNALIDAKGNEWNQSIFCDRTSQFELEDQGYFLSCRAITTLINQY